MKVKEKAATFAAKLWLHVNATTQGNASSSVAGSVAF
jgi:hypothetical protein